MVKSNSDFSGIGNLYSKLNKLDNRQSALESRLTDKYGWENDASDSLKVHYNEEDDNNSGGTSLNTMRSYNFVDFFSGPENDNFSEISAITGGTGLDTDISDKPIVSTHSEVV